MSRSAAAVARNSNAFWFLTQPRATRRASCGGTRTCGAPWPGAWTSSPVSRRRTSGAVSQGPGVGGGPAHRGTAHPRRRM